MFDSYNVILITVLFLAVYLTSGYLVKTKLLKRSSHRKIWNWLLLISFLGSGSLGLILAFAIDNKLSINWYREMLWYHVEFGIVMALISLAHLGWHLSYYTRIFKKK